MAARKDKGQLVTNGEPKSLNDWIVVDGKKLFMRDLYLVPHKGGSPCNGCILRLVPDCTITLHVGTFVTLQGKGGKSRMYDLILVHKPPKSIKLLIQNIILWIRKRIKL